MKKKQKPEGPWSQELREKGWKKFLLERVREQGVLKIREIIDHTRRCRNTVMKHVRRLVREHEHIKWRSEHDTENVAIHDTRSAARQQ